jgi:hypothetical protein
MKIIQKKIIQKKIIQKKITQNEIISNETVQNGIIQIIQNDINPEWYYPDNPDRYNPVLGLAI